MVFYIIACHKEGQSEDAISKLIASWVLKENNRSLGELFPLTNTVSFLCSYQYRWTKLNSKLDLWTN